MLQPSVATAREEHQSANGRDYPAEHLITIGETVLGIAHSIKNVMGMIKGGEYLVDSGLRRQDLDRIGEGWDMVKTGNGYISDLVLKMLTLSRNTTPAYEEIRLAEIFESLEAVLGPKAVAKDVTLDIAVIPDDLTEVVDVGCIREALCVHKQRQADVTVLRNASSGLEEIYLCNERVVDYVPEAGYCDIKENLIPRLLRSGKKVFQMTSISRISTFQNWSGYLRGITTNLEGILCRDSDFSLIQQSDCLRMWSSGTATIHPSVMIKGDVAIMDGACIDEGAAVFGPAIIGSDTHLGRNAVVDNCVLWDRVDVGNSASVRQCVVRDDVAIRPHDDVKGLPVDTTRRGWNMSGQKIKTDKYADTGLELLVKRFLPVIGLSAVCLAFLWSHWAGLVDLWQVWNRSDEYSSGLLVPALAGYILWSRRDILKSCRIRPWWPGVVVLFGAQAMRVLGVYHMYGSAIRLSVVAGIVALVIWLGGGRIFGKTASILLFLCLMLPWPNRVQTAITLPLQDWATTSAVFCLETVGYDIVRNGNIIKIGDTSVAVAEACNGLRMITAFFVIAGLVALLSKRAWWEKWLIFLSSLPIALVCNTIRLTVTSIAFTKIEGDHWEQLFHDFGGYAMMPFALVLVVLELWVIKLLTILPETQETIVVSRRTDRGLKAEG